MMFAGCLLGFLPGPYYYWWSRRMKHAPRRPNATVADGAGVVETFPGTSIWPFTSAWAAFMVLALVFGIWFAVPGVALLVTAFAGATAESRRGGDV